MRNRLVALLAALAMTAGLLVGVTVNAPAASASCTTCHSITSAMHWFKGKWSSGPNSYTRYQRVQINSFTWNCRVRKYDTNDTMHQYPNPATASNARRKTAAAQSKVDLVRADRPMNHPTSTSTGSEPACANIVARQPLSWWNPFSWNWGKILKSFWKNIWNKCATGALQGVVGTASGTLAVNLLTRGARLYVGPQGYAALAIGGCIVNLSF
jgi:hypothetical protein